MIDAKTLSNIINEFTLRVKDIFNVELDRAFIVSSYLLSQNELPYMSNLSDEDNKELNDLFKDFKMYEYDIESLRLAFSLSYSLSLKDKENLKVDTTPELINIYLKEIVKTLYDTLNYEVVSVLNPSPNNGVLALSLINYGIKDSELLLSEERKDFYLLSLSLRDLANSNYNIIDMLPDYNYRCDIIVSDPFLSEVEDILIFFEDYHMYLNMDGFMVLVLPNPFIRSRVFADTINRYKYSLLGVIEYPSDLHSGVLDSSIVILENNQTERSEFFRAIMPSVKNVDENINTIKLVKDYINKYVGEEYKNENNGN